MEKRPIDLVVISDTHLGTYGCHAEHLLKYLKSITPKTLVLNGDIIDMWQFNKNYFPSSHMQVIRHITWLMEEGVTIYYIPGNHDEMLRRFDQFSMGSLKIVNKLLLNLNGAQTWIFHGDVFDVTMRHSKWLARLGSKGYDTLILLNNMVNFLLEKAGKGRISLSRRIKSSVKSAVKFIQDFEKTAIDIATSKDYHTVICGHIHQPANKAINNEGGSVRYLNSGDWVENLTALEYNKDEWTIYRYQDDPLANGIVLDEEDNAYLENQEIFENMLADFFNDPQAKKATEEV